ncbi:MAG: ParB/RepB/Spo0J family partition protein, partial [Burkholderiales bacterium]
RRWRATKLAGLTHIPALIREFSDGDALAISLIENIQRKDLNVIEESRGYHRLIDEFSLTHEELAKITGKSRSHVTNLLRLLNLHVEVQEMLLLGQLDMGHARALLPLPTHLQVSLAHEVVDADLTTSEVERMVAKLLYKQQLDVSTKAESTAVDPDITRLETKIADKLGMVVNIKHGRKGNGKITLSYNSLDELDNLIRLF